MALPEDEVVKLGDRAQDRISGLRGIVVGITDYLFQCRAIGIQAEGLHDGSPIKTVWFDEDQVDVVKKSVLTVRPVTRAGTREPAWTGGPERSTPARSDPARSER